MSEQKVVIKRTSWFLPLLALMFIYLKLTSVVTWSWWVVLLPLYAVPAVGLGVVIILLAGACLIDLFSSKP